VVLYASSAALIKTNARSFINLRNFMQINERSSVGQKNSRNDDGAKKLDAVYFMLLLQE